MKTAVKTRTKTRVALASTAAIILAAAGFAGALRSQDLRKMSAPGVISGSYLPGYVPGYYDEHKPGYGKPGYVPGYGFFHPELDRPLPDLIKEWRKKEFWKFTNPFDRRIGQ